MIKDSKRFMQFIITNHVELWDKMVKENKMFITSPYRNNESLLVVGNPFDNGEDNAAFMKALAEYEGIEESLFASIKAE